MNGLEFVGDDRVPHLSARQRALGHDGISYSEFTFGDFLDIINPLQHIPIVSSIYRAITDDQISPHARILGDTLFGGPTGFLSSIANVLYEEIAGEDVGETVIALFTGEDEAPEPPQFAGDGGTVSAAGALPETPPGRSEEHTSELQSLMRSSYAVFCLKKKNKTKTTKANTSESQ